MFPFVAVLLLHLSMYLFGLVCLALSTGFYAASHRLYRQLAASKISTLKAIFQGGRISISRRVSVIRLRCSSPHSHFSKEYLCPYTVSDIYHHTHQHKMLLLQFFFHHEIAKCVKRIVRINK